MAAGKRFPSNDNSVQPMAKIGKAETGQRGKGSGV
jgi:hypothetical protein